MKKLTVLLGCCLIATWAAAAEPSTADQKWLNAVEKMIVSGEKKVSTPSEARATLLKEWAGKQGYPVKVTKTDNGFSIEVSGKETSKGIAQR